MKNALEIVILAAGLGTRMKSSLPKVLHEVCGEPMLGLLLREISDAAVNVDFPCEIRGINIVVGHGRNLVMDRVRALQEAGKVRVPVVFSVQEEQLGTGHAVKCAIANSGGKSSESGTLAVLNGDLPLFTREALADFVRAHLGAKSAASLASTEIANPGSYGRVIRKGGGFQGVVEHEDATAAQKKIREINGGVYLLERATLLEALGGLSNRNASGEFYLPDVFAFARKKKKKILAHEFADAGILRGANDMMELAEAQKILYARTAAKWMREGVFLHDPETIRLGPSVRFGKGVAVAPNVEIAGESVIGDGVKIGSFCRLVDVKIGNRTLIRNGTCAEKSVIGADCAIGPMAHLRPGTRLADHVKIGNFAEIKESSIGAHTSVAHLSYVGDAEIGERVNVGCGFVTCNYDGVTRDGRRKHRTKIGNRVFIGSDSQVIAPIEIADGTYIASGSTVSESVAESDSLVIARAKQVTKPGYAKKYR
ncbi:MAG: bifunctional UDP-N-acetylglucosamine diphosphorylase/glucosamine-1-phosphate N-acetyltransferase GlmU [Deltaproteobacteria bacterium]|nr:bifunctional UDP-N-acetylglucosamine diphosphorylase/glucosamine-1-phosphate N-acetyltransferase GlmU [Deltaproteobacteria bacterium]